MTEVQLIEGCKREESFAQRLLYDRYVDSMYLLCLRYIPGTADAEEVLSDAFLKCFKNMHQFQYAGEGSMRAWLSRILINECLMFLRRKKQLVISIEERPELPVADTSDTALDKMHASDILDYIRKLPTGYRTVLNLFVFEELGHKEIAALLQISENTSKSQLFKARALLKQKMNGG
ncbi:RNA polymerase sigma factor [Taibaiella koreensis]|uniref:RNA polymerase sigma factor n=1 Tax=Taibaiella koreensis TaxID=1268548 RepID=UPI000E59E82E|nr:sigma-70 family RNA polymerase sigma factor [Taibaiella koreensis]